MNTNSDPIVALSASMYGSGGYCGQVGVLSCSISAPHPVPQWVCVTNTATGKTAYGMTRDKCPSCGLQDLGMPML